MQNPQGRVANASLNTVWAIISQGVTVLLSLFSRKVFLDHLGAEYLGVNSLFSDVLMLFSFADLGFGTAILFSLFRPIAVNDENKIKSLLLFYRNIYNYVILALIVISIAFLPFLFTIKTEIPIGDLIIFYGLFQINNIVAYFWAYRTSYVIACQKERVLTKINLFFSFFTTLLVILFIVLFENYYIYLAISITSTIAQRVWTNFYIIKKYPITIVKDVAPLEKKEKKDVLKKSYALLVTRIGNLLINQTDSLVVSTMINVAQWGLASNYLVIKKSIFTITDKIYSGLLPSMGNLVAGDDKEKELTVFLRYDFLNAWLHTFVFVAMATLSSPFVALFFGDKALLSNNFVFFFFLAAFVDGLRSPVSVLREASGTFEADKWYTMLAAFFNLAVSLPLAYFMGLSGVFIGTICAMLVLHMSRSWVLFRTGNYSLTTLKYLWIVLVHIFVGLVLLSILYAVFLFVAPLIPNSILLFVLKALIVLVVPNLIWILIYNKNQDVKNIINYLTKKIR